MANIGERSFWTDPLSWWFLPLCGLFIVAAFLQTGFQVIEPLVSDWIFPGLVLWGALAGVIVLLRRGRSLGAPMWGLVLVSIWVFYFGHVAFLAVNGLFDATPTNSYRGVITASVCSKGNHWTIVGAPTMPTSTNAMQLDGPLDCRGIIGDSVQLAVRGGFFHRPWLASYTLQRPDPVQEALRRHRALIARLRRPSTARDSAH